MVIINWYKMVLKEINIKNRTYYFWNDQIWINNFDSKNLKIDKKSVMGSIFIT